jgi:hypothetical protein
MTVQLTTPGIGAAELQKLLIDVDPGALLMPPRLLRRVIKQDRAIGGVGLQVPHRKSYTIGREALLPIVDRSELGVSEDWPLPAQVVLLACPETWLATHTREQALVRFWRLLFHARIDLAIQNMISDGRLTESRIREIIHRIGTVEVEEAVRVIRAENFLLPPADLRVCFTEFVSLFFELRYFARPLLPTYFPATEDLGRLEAILAEVVDPAPLHAATRLAGAPEPVVHAHDDHEPADERGEKLPPPAGMPSAAYCQKLLAQAERAGQRGNAVRSAILRLRAADVAPPELLDSAHEGALSDLERLISRLQAALELHDREAEEWRAALPALLGPASRGIWPPAARLLYDLQKVCIDYERDLYALDMVEWVASFGRKKIKREVPLQAEVLLVKHLRQAAGRLARVQIGDEERRRLAILLRAAIHHAEDRLREKIRPILTDSLVEVGFKPANQPEQVSLRKIVEELLDRVTERGFINMGDLRDAVSRNQVKLEDATPLHTLLGDKLIKANRKLAIKLDGVYHRGEIYLRWLQRLSSLLFGTGLGRWITLFLLLPFGGAFAALVFAQEMLHLAQVKVHVKGGLFSAFASESTAPAKKETPPVKREEQPPPQGEDSAADLANELEPEGPDEGEGALFETPEDVHPSTGGLHLDIPAPVALAILLMLGFFIMGVIHSARFRSKTWEGTKLVWKGIRGVLFDWPVAFLHLPAVERVFESRPMVFFRRRLFVPLLFGCLAAAICLVIGIKGVHYDEWIAFGIAFVLSLLFFSSRLGRHTEEAITDWLARNWYWLRVDALPGLINLTIQLFKDIMDRIERVLYTVDEWLRFRPGDNKLALVYKPILGLIWFLLTYLIRLLINVFIEPTVNPIKHFPAVTVTAKLILPLVIPAKVLADGTFIGGPIAVALAPHFGLGTANTIAGLFLLLFPGLGGFLVWELKENWKLYRANRKKDLRPVLIGHHGETLLRFLKPGFHSGTLPKLYSKMRRAERRGDGRKIFKQHEALHHIKESLRRFVERELLMLLEQSKSWGGLKLLVGEVRTATNRVRIELRCPDLDETGVWLVFDERFAWLVAGIRHPGWLHRLNNTQKAAFETALAGLYKLGGVALVREQIESCLPSATVSYAINGRGLILFPGGDFAKEERIPLQGPFPPAESAAGNGQLVFAPQQLLYSNVPITWDDWVRAWEDDKQGRIPDLPQLQRVRLLPAVSHAPSPSVAAEMVPR